MSIFTVSQIGGELGHRGAIREVGAVPGEAAPGLADLLLDLAAGVLQPRANADDVGAGVGQRGGHGEADAAAGAGHDGGRARQVEHGLSVLSHVSAFHTCQALSQPGCSR